MKYLLFIALGLLHFLLGVILAGAGHGWVAGLYCSIPSILIYPLVGLAFYNKNKMLAKILMIILFLLLLVLIYLSKSEEQKQAIHLFERLPLFLIIVYLIFSFTPIVVCMMTLFKKNPISNS